MFIFLLNNDVEFGVITLLLGNQIVPLLELLLNSFQLNRVRESILRLHHFLQLLAQTRTFVNINLNLNFNFLELRAAYVFL